MHSTAQHSTAQHSTAQHSTAQHHNYVISLTSAQERRAHIIQEFGKQDIPFEFFDAITPDLIEEKTKEFGIDISNTTLTKGEIACALSHISLWHLAKEKNLDYICIFEDDIYLGENAKAFISNSYIDDDVDIVRLETFNANRQPKYPKIEKYFLNRKFYTLKSKYVGMGAYIITPKGISFLLNKMADTPLLEPIDDIIFERFLMIDSYKVWQMSPAVCVQDMFLNNVKDLKSSLDNDRDIRCANIPKKKRTLTQKIYQELTRPLFQLKNKLFYHYIPFK